MRLNINDYVRSVEYGIGRVIKLSRFGANACIQFNNCEDWIRRDKTSWVTKNKKIHLENPSEHLINLIKMGDYVNGYEVIYIDEKNAKGQREIKINKPYGIYYGEIHYLWITKTNDIKEVLTKEQYEANVYKIKERK